MEKPVIIRVFVTHEDGQWIVTSGGKENGRFKTMREVDQLLSASREIAGRVTDRKVSIVKFLDMSNPAATSF